MRTFFFLLAILTLVSLGATLNTRDRASYPERMLILGLPAWGPTFLSTPDGEEIPAGCGPEAARLLLLYYDHVFGTSFVREDPKSAISELHRLMGTITVEWKGLKQGLTWPWAFRAGLRAYIEAHSGLPLEVHTFTSGLGEVFFRAVRLIQEGTPAVLLFDWQGEGGIFPTHYAVVVGYNLSSDELVLNPGWGYEFQLLSFRDERILPVSLIWLEFPGQVLKLQSVSPKTLPKPVLRKHGLPREAVTWPPPTRVLSLSEGLFLWVWE